MLKALVVDDDELVLATVSALLSSLEFDVVEAPSGRCALRMLMECSFDLIVTDLFMADIDGFELMIKIREINAAIPIILMTGGGKLFPVGSSRLKDLTGSAKFLGASCVLQKPFRKEAMIQLLASLALPAKAYRTETIAIV